MDNEQEYITLTQAAKELEWNKATVYDWIKTLGIQTHKFVRNKNTFLLIADVERLKEIKEKPWTAGPNTARSARSVTEKAEKTTVIEKAVKVKADTEKAEKRVYSRKQDSNLPDGCILATEFATLHGVKRETFRDHMTKGLGPGLIGSSTETIPQRDQVDYSERVKPNRPNEREKFLDRPQQLAALLFWKRHKVGFTQCDRDDCPCHSLAEKENN